jgi:hypothetical protein
VNGSLAREGRPEGTILLAASPLMGETIDESEGRCHRYHSVFCERKITVNVGNVLKFNPTFASTTELPLQP